MLLLLFCLMCITFNFVNAFLCFDKSNDVITIFLLSLKFQMSPKLKSDFQVVMWPWTLSASLVSNQSILSNQTSPRGKNIFHMNVKNIDILGIVFTFLFLVLSKFKELINFFPSIFIKELQVF